MKQIAEFVKKYDSWISKSIAISGLVFAVGSLLNQMPYLTKLVEGLVH